MNEKYKFVIKTVNNLEFHIGVDMEPDEFGNYWAMITNMGIEVIDYSISKENAIDRVINDYINKYSPNFYFEKKKSMRLTYLQYLKESYSITPEIAEKLKEKGYNGNCNFDLFEVKKWIYETFKIGILDCPKGEGEEDKWVCVITINEGIDKGKKVYLTDSLGVCKSYNCNYEAIQDAINYIVNNLL